MKPQITTEFAENTKEHGILFESVVPIILYENITSNLEDDCWRSTCLCADIAILERLAAKVGERDLVAEVGEAVYWAICGFYRIVRVERSCQDEHQEVWWASEAGCAPYQPEPSEGLVVAIIDPAELPGLTIFFSSPDLNLCGRKEESSLRRSRYGTDKRAFLKKLDTAELQTDRKLLSLCPSARNHRFHKTTGS
jgi:hypothetical protein